MSAAGENNDGGMVAVLFLMAGAIAYAIFVNAAFYAESTAWTDPSSSKSRRTVRFISGFANIGNGCIHAVLVCYMLANADNQSIYWEKERELGGVEGPVGLMLINTAVGYLALASGDKYTKLSVGWNSFVAVLGTAIPIVWNRFIAEGLSTWPFIPIFIWFFIFCMELAAFTTSLTWAMLPQTESRRDKRDR